MDNKLTIEEIDKRIIEIQEKIKDCSIILAGYDRQLRQLQKSRQEILSKQFTPSEVK